MIIANNHGQVNVPPEQPPLTVEPQSELCHSPSGIPYIDWGGDGPPLHLAHANGFPPATYRAFARCLAGYHCLSYKARPLWGGQDPGHFHHWRELAADLSQFLRDVAPGPVIGVGHSLGAVTTLFSAAARPALFRALVLIDPVIFPLPMSPVLAVAETLGLSRRARLPTLTRRRRMEWASREEVFSSFRRAHVFARWSDAALWDYVTAVTEERPEGGVRLRYPREWEARIFETVPPDSWLAMLRLRAMPTLVLRGELSTTFRSGTMRTMRWFVPRARFVQLEGADHFVPITHPQETAEAVLSFLEGL